MYCAPTAFDRYILCTFPFLLQWIFQHLLIINCMFHWCHHSSKWFREEDLCLCVSSSLSLSFPSSLPLSLFVFNIPVTHLWTSFWDMLFSSTASNGFSQNHGPEQNYYYYHHTHNAKLFLCHSALCYRCGLHSDYRTLPLSATLH